MHTLPTKILCAIDFSNFTEIVIQKSISLAQKFNANLILLHTIYHPEDALYGSADFKRSGEWEKQKVIATDRIHQLMSLKDTFWKAVVLYGDPVEEIPKYAENNHIDLVIVASYGVSGIKRFLIGTVVERLARKLTQPLLILRADKQQNDPFQPLFQSNSKMIICCDLLDETKKMIKYGLMWARNFKLSVILLHVIEKPIDEDEIEQITAPYSQAQQMFQEKIKSKMLEMVPDNYLNTVPLEVRIVAGQAQETLLEMADEIDAALMVLGVRYHSAFGKLLISSTTEVVLRYAPCPVITVQMNYA
jgi:nucleotide-binding universal stress UspA family protein